MAEGLPAPAADPVGPALAAIRRSTEFVPSVGIILGSGLGDALSDIEESASFSFTELPGFPPSTVPGHDGRLVLGTSRGTPVAAFHGRVHYYEHHSMSKCSMTVRLAHALGAETMVVTAAVGGLSPEVGPIAVVTDHIGLMGATPLAGWRFPDGSPAFVDVSAAYTPALIAIAGEAAAELGMDLSPAIYAAVAGPAYETSAESEFLRRGGASVVGMSVIPEVAAACALGMDVLALCAVVNPAGTAIDHSEVVSVGRDIGAVASRLLAAILPRLNPER